MRSRGKKTAALLSAALCVMLFGAGAFSGKQQAPQAEETVQEQTASENGTEEMQRTDTAFRKPDASGGTEAAAAEAASDAAQSAGNGQKAADPVQSGSSSDAAAGGIEQNHSVQTAAVEGTEQTTEEAGTEDGKAAGALVSVDPGLAAALNQASGAEHLYVTDQKQEVVLALTDDAAELVTRVGLKGSALSSISYDTVKTVSAMLKAPDGTYEYTGSDGNTAEAEDPADVPEQTADYSYSGWQTLNGIRYYFDPATHRPLSGRQVIDGVVYNFGSDGALLESGTGIDVSRWQQEIDWNAVRTAVSFAIIRCANGQEEDPYFYRNMAGAKAAGIPVGVYLYSQATGDPNAALMEAGLAVSMVAKAGGVSLPIFIDWEGATANGTDPYTAIGCINMFAAHVMNSGYTAGVYSSKNTFLTKVSMEYLDQRVYVWVAQYNSALAQTNYSGRYNLWQYTSSGTVPGINGRVDMDKIYF